MALPKVREQVRDFFGWGADSRGRQLTPRSSITMRAPTTVMAWRAHRVSTSRSCSAVRMPFCFRSFE